MEDLIKICKNPTPKKRETHAIAANGPQRLPNHEEKEDMADALCTSPTSHQNNKK
jgi:hypothetical protein